MQYRLYTEADKELFTDPDKILLYVREFFELDGDIDEKTFEKIKVCFPYAAFEEAELKKLKKATVFKRAGRSDSEFTEICSVIDTVKPKSNISVRNGMTFYFNDDADGEAVRTFLSLNVNPYVCEAEYSGQERMAEAERIRSTLTEFCHADYEGLLAYRQALDIHMPIDDLMCVQNYFISESREPTHTELKIIDRFFSESFRHTTFETILDRLESDDPRVSESWKHYRRLRADVKPSLSDITGSAAKMINDPDVVPASSKLRGVRIPLADENEELLLLVKNESHNRSVTVVPYDGAAGSLGCALKDLYCAFGSAYDCYRVIGRGRTDSVRKKAKISAFGFADTASQVGVPIRKCRETLSHIYNEKQLEICSVLAVSNRGATEKMLSKSPMTGDKIYLVGSRTGADGTVCKHHSMRARDSYGEYIPVTDASVLAAMQRLFSKTDLSDIAVCINDVGSGGIVCAVGEMVQGADISTAAIKTRYGGLDCADAVLSESCDRMLICVRAENGARLEYICNQEGLESSCIATVNDTGLFNVRNENGELFVSLARKFLMSGGAEKHLSAFASAPMPLPESAALKAVYSQLETVGTLKKLFTGKHDLDIQRAFVLSAGEIENAHTELAHTVNRVSSGAYNGLFEKALYRDYSLAEMRYRGQPIDGKDGKRLFSSFTCATLPYISKLDPFRGAYLTVCEAVLKQYAAGNVDNKIYLALQEYFPEHGNSSSLLGGSVASMLGAFEAQLSLGIPSVGGKISIGKSAGEQVGSSYVTAFAFSVASRSAMLPSTLTQACNRLILISPQCDKDEVIPDGDALKEMLENMRELMHSGAVRSGAVVNGKNIVTVLMQMSRGSGRGVIFEPESEPEELFDYKYCSIIFEVSPDAKLPKGTKLIGTVTDESVMRMGEERFSLVGSLGRTEKKPRATETEIYPFYDAPDPQYGKIKPISGKVSVLIPETPYTVSQSHIEESFNTLGAEAKIFRLDGKNISEFAKRLKRTDILWLGDTLGKSAFTTALLLDKRVRGEIDALIERGGLVYGNGSAFEALVVSGLLPLDTGRFRFERDASELINEAVRLKVVSNASPLMRKADRDTVYNCYVSGRRQRLLIDPGYANELARSGRILTQYMSDTNPTGVCNGIDSVCSENGRVVGKISRGLQISAAMLGHFSVYVRSEERTDE